MSPMPTRMCVAADTAAFRCTADGRLELLLVQRGNEPFKGRWALPGGFVEEDEDLPDAASRELMEETGLRPVVMEQVGAWGRPGRDPRFRTVSAVYLAVAAPRADDVRGADDAANAAWHSPSRLPPLAFDHDAIVPVVLDRLRCLCERTHIVFAFLPGSFDAKDVQRVLTALGCRDAASCAERVIDAARLEVSGTALHRLAARFTAPLREPVFLFEPSDPEA
jgi:8-oxo-dGTP diphosphatase